MKAKGIYASMVILAMLGIALLIPSATIMVMMILSPYWTAKLIIGAISGFYMASALLALASIPLLNKGFREGYLMGLASCLLGFSTFVSSVSFLVLGILKYDYPYEYSSTVMLLIVVGGAALLLEFLASIFLASSWEKAKESEGEKKRETSLEKE
ncbi:hypothetical protein KEJ36_02505 [Candidatus Bathyarchaeota archaeon]|nr:hypothetical protein [Candidatus Bathyarchaeota archaeon]MBS7627681.1 hypothetical protein [Candidatus Bathyarchaeota archaeon]